MAKVKNVDDKRKSSLPNVISTSSATNSPQTIKNKRSLKKDFSAKSEQDDAIRFKTSKAELEVQKSEQEDEQISSVTDSNELFNVSFESVEVSFDEETPKNEKIQSGNDAERAKRFSAIDGKEDAVISQLQQPEASVKPVFAEKDLLMSIMQCAHCQAMQSSNMGGRAKDIIDASIKLVQDDVPKNYNNSEDHHQFASRTAKAALCFVLLSIGIALLLPLFSLQHDDLTCSSFPT